MQKTTESSRRWVFIQYGAKEIFIGDDVDFDSVISEATFSSNCYVFKYANFQQRLAL